MRVIIQHIVKLRFKNIFETTNEIELYSTIRSQLALPLFLIVHSPYVVESAPFEPPISEVQPVIILIPDAS